MSRISLHPEYYAEANIDESLTGGEIYHFAQGVDGWGSVSTPVASFFVTTPPVDTENILRHLRIDCIVRDRPGAPNPAWLARNLATAMLAQKLVQEPLWLSWWLAKELGGEARGHVFDLN